MLEQPRGRGGPHAATYLAYLQPYQMRAQMVQRIWEESRGMSAVTGLELRFQ
jgi:hypothetical protein